MQFFLCLCICWLSCYVDATVYIVDGTNGHDENSGLTTTTAFKNIQHCVNQLVNPGDECKIRKGRYHESIDITGLYGTAEKPFVIKGFDDDRPIWDGTVAIQPEKWDFDKKTGICSASIDHDITALFLNDDLLTAARWPNAFWSDKSCFSNSHWGRCDQTSSHGKIVDDGKAGLADSGIDATGAMAILNIGSFCTFVGQVTSHSAGSNTFFYHDLWNNSNWKDTHNQYFLEASRALLDAPEEWFYDKETKVLYMIPPAGSDCPDPSLDTLRGRTMDYGLTIRDATGITMANITMFATNVDAQSESKKTFIDNIRFENVDILFGASSHRMLQDPLKPKWTQMKAKIGNGKISIVNCTFLGSEGVALDYAGSSYIHNNLFAYNDWTGHMMDHPMGGLGTVHGADPGEVSHNTLWYNGASAGIRPGSRSNISYNRVVGQCSGLIMNDGAGIHLGTGNYKYSLINYIIFSQDSFRGSSVRGSSE